MNPADLLAVSHVARRVPPGPSRDERIVSGQCAPDPNPDPVLVEGCACARDAALDDAARVLLERLEQPGPVDADTLRACVWGIVSLKRVPSIPSREAGR